MKQALLITTYAVIIGILGMQAAQTVFQGSLVILRNTTASQLTKQKSTLLAEYQKLQQERAESLSLESIQKDEQLSAFEPISNPIQLTHIGTEVASR